MYGKPVRCAGLGIAASLASPGELILQDFADAVPAADKLDRLIAVIEGTRCFRLSYATVSSAADVVCREVGSGHPSDLGVSHVHP